MKNDNWEKAKEIFAEARKLTPGLRGKYLQEVCGKNTELFHEVESLLVSHDIAQDLMETPAVNEVADFIFQTENSSSGKSFGNYEIIEQIGEGGMGEVFLAKDKKLDRSVAIKSLKEKFGRHKSNLKRFIQEAKAASALNHPNILTIYEFGESDDTPYIVSEFVKGNTLREILREKKLTPPEILEIAVQIANALCAAHQANLVHRDIKPENVMIREDGLVKVLDFGLAKLIEPKRVGFEKSNLNQNQTAKGLILGTVNYMSPEQAKGEKVNERTDIFSLGVVVYEMIAGHTPFGGESVSETFANLIKQEPPPLSISGPDLPDKLQEIVLKMLRKNPDSRQSTIKEVLRGLKSLQENLLIERRRQESDSAGRQNETYPYPVAGKNLNSVTNKLNDHSTRQVTRPKLFLVLAFTVLLTAVGLGFWYFNNLRANPKPIESIAILPFVNQSGIEDTEYLSDGMTETLISNLSRLPNLNVKARSSVFRYKGKEIDVNTIAKELNVQAIVNGRVMQRGQDLSLYIELVDITRDKVIWSQTYNRPINNIFSLQNDISMDVSQNLKTKLSGTDEKRVTKKYTQNTEAYQLYLKGRYHFLKITRSETQKAVSYFEQAIALDPNYALAYCGLADSYRALGLAGEMTPSEFFPKAKAAAQRAIEIDDTLSDPYSVLGFITSWYDWNWNEAEKQFQRALELDPNNADAHIYYANLHSILGRHPEALAEAKRAVELDPLNLRIKVLEAQFFIHSGQVDEALARLQTTFELDQNYWFAHIHAASAYIEKGMYAQAIEESHKARNIYDSSRPGSFLGFALAKSGRKAEARAELEKILKLSAEIYVSGYNVAMIYNGLDEREKTFLWLERGIQQREPRMAFLKVEPKWNNLHNDPRFQDLLQRIGLTRKGELNLP